MWRLDIEMTPALPVWVSWFDLVALTSGDTAVKHSLMLLERGNTAEMHHLSSAETAMMVAKVILTVQWWILSAK